MMHHRQLEATDSETLAAAVGGLDTFYLLFAVSQICIVLCSRIR